MNTYQKFKDDPIFGSATSVRKYLSDGMASIPFCPGNIDYEEFKKDINEGTGQLQDANGNVMSAEEAKAFIATLPA